MSEQQVEDLNAPTMEAVEQQQQEPQPEELPVEIEGAEKAEKPVKEKKPRAANPSHSHPTYFEMIKEALVALNEKSGSSPHAIAKFISEKHKDLPANFNKMLGVQLKNCTSNGKLTKLKASFKLSDGPKKIVKSAVTGKKKPVKPKSSTTAVTKSRAVKKAAPKKVAAPLKKKTAAGVKPKQVKSIKSATAKVVPKGKKPVPVKASDASHPTYFQMIKEAILALKERSGSSPIAIAKYMEDKHSKILPENFKKLLAVQLKKCVASEKLIKVKASFKLSDASKKEVKAAPKAVAEKKKPETKPKAAVVPKGKTGKKHASTAAPTKKKPTPAVAKKTGVRKPATVVAKKAGLKKPVSVVAKKAAGVKKPAGAVAKKTGLKKPAGAVAKKAALKKKTKAATPVKPKQPKSIRSPAAKRARRA
ncbi:hypothetical protein MKX01_033143 [Papaver californicum]|nr:hypothetical protein MKX01_033143 [Papaver californicum]